MAVQNQSNKQLKNGATDTRYQSTFLPIFQKAETKIKVLILLALFYMYSKPVLFKQIEMIIDDVKKKLPPNLTNREAYINGLYRSSQFMISQYLDKPKVQFIQVKEAITNNVKVDRRLNLDSPKNVMDFIQTKAPTKDMWAERKAAVRVENYPKQLKKTIEELAERQMTTSESGKKPISLWQKAELDVRYNKQMEKLDQLRSEGVEYCYLSSHPDCSKRCEKWQGKLVSLNKHATMSGFRVEKLNGQWVYSLTDIMNQVDKYGYHNNIYCGFNCRHYLIKYDGQKAPTEYTEKDIKKQRAIEENIRKMEREIRRQKTRAKLYEEIGEKNLSKKINDYVKILIERYKRYCESNGYAWEKYRIDI